MEAHLGSDTYMVPLLSPVRWRLGAGEAVSAASFSYATELRHRSPRFVALGALVFSVVVLVANIFST